MNDIKNVLSKSNMFLMTLSGTGTEPKRTGYGTRTFKILRTRIGTETFILINKVPEPNWNF